MFGKSKKSAAQAAPLVPIQTIPADFYAGANPVVKFKTVERVVERGDESKPAPLKPHEKAALDKATAVGQGKPLHPVHLLSNRKFLFIVGGVLFVVFILGAGGYYYFANQKKTPESAAPLAVPIIPLESTPAASVVTSEVPATPEVIPETPSSMPAVTADGPLQFPSQLLGDSKDSDTDGFTDPEEELFKTDPFKPDTDEDKFSDSHEMYNLYNPAGKEPEKLIDSGLVKNFTNPVFGYDVYYPANWAIGNVDPNYRDVLFSTITGENIEIRVFDKQAGQSFQDWFALWAASEQLSDLSSFISAFKQSGQMRKDYLVYYFEDVGHVYALLYHTTDSAVINYRTVMKLVARSFRLNSVVQTLAPRIDESGAAPETATQPILAPTSTSSTSPSATSTI